MSDQIARVSLETKIILRVIYHLQNSLSKMSRTFEVILQQSGTAGSKSFKETFPWKLARQYEKQQIFV